MTFDVNIALSYFFFLLNDDFKPHLNDLSTIKRIIVLRDLCVGPTSPAEQHGGVGDTQQAVVTEALQHGSVHMEAAGQVLRGEGCPTDEPGQALTHGQCLSQLP